MLLGQLNVSGAAGFHFLIVLDNLLPVVA